MVIVVLTKQHIVLAFHHVYADFCIQILNCKTTQRDVSIRYKHV